MMVPKLNLAVAATMIICSAALPANETSARAGYEDNTWVQFENLYYYYSTETLTWFDARQYCYELGGTLARPRTKTINDFLLGVVQPNNTEVWPAWIDLTDIEQESNFRYSDGSDPSFTNWIDGEPNNTGGIEDCVTYGHVTESQTWNDLNCERELRFICEAE